MVCGFGLTNQYPVTKRYPDMRAELRFGTRHPIMQLGRQPSPAQHPLQCQGALDTHQSERKPAASPVDSANQPIRFPCFIRAVRPWLSPTGSTNGHSKREGSNHQRSKGQCRRRFRRAAVVAQCPSWSHPHLAAS
jgi:hypothetical protein